MSIDQEVKELKKEIEQIKSRNKKVEADKAWETSWTRRIFIALSTYILISILMLSIGVPDPFANAIIPGVAYLISSTSIGILKDWWLQKKSK